MDYWSALEVLGLEDDDELDREQVRRTYMRRLREHPPERDPEGFRLLREAYESVRNIVPDAPRVAKEEPAKIVIVEAPATETVDTPASDSPPSANGTSYSLKGDAIVKDDLRVDDIDELPDDDDEIDDDDDEIDDDDDEPDDIDDDEIDDDDASYEHRPIDVDELGRPTMSLSTLVDKLLVLLQHEEVDEALALEREWRAHGDTDDHRQANAYIALKWALTRELLAVAGNLPAPVTRALAKGIDGSDFAPIRPELERYRHTNPHQAEDANVVLATRANDIYQQIKGTLYVAPAPRPPQHQYFAPNPPSVSSKSSFSGIGVGIAAMLILVRVMARSDCSTTSSYDKYKINIPNIKLDPYVYKAPDIDYSKLAGTLDEPKLADPTADRSQLMYEISDELYRLKLYEYDGEIVARADALATQVYTEDCAKMRPALKKLEDDSLSPSAHAKKFIVAIHARVEIVCPAPKPKPKKKKSSQ